MTAMIADGAKKYALSQRPPTWEEWKKSWDEVRDSHSAVSLLHIGLSAIAESDEEKLERLKYYLTIADGHYRGAPFYGAEIRTKAFKMLADYFERFLTRSIDGLYSLPPQGVDAVLEFFRCSEEDKDGRVVLYNLDCREGELSGGYAMEKMKINLIKLCRSIWFRNYWLEEWGDKDTKAHLDTLGPKIIEILLAMDRTQLDNLVDVVLIYEKAENQLVPKVRWELFTEPCCTKLAELALREGKSVEQALVAGSTAAKILTLVNAVRQEQKVPKFETA